MAAEAIYQVKQAEDQAKELVREAAQQAQQTLAQAREQSAAQRQAALEKARQERAAMIEAALAKAQERCDEIAAQGGALRESILSPQPDKLERAIKLVMERIVSV